MKRGRPKVKDKKESFTVSLRVTEKKELVKKFGTLSNAIKSLLNNKNEKI